MPQLGRNVPEVVKVNRLDSFGDFLIHRVVLQNRMFWRVEGTPAAP
jgi:hypothetical protein